jgi:GT2 family glycosyltransferase
VVTRDRASLFRRFVLESLRSAAASGAEVVVVDQSAGEETAELVDGIAGCRYLRSPSGLSRGRNLAIEATHAPVLAFVDDDVTFEPSWPARVQAVFADDPEAGAVCGRGVDGSGALVPGREGGRYRWPTSPFALGSGFNLAFRRQALERAGPFDVELGAGARYRSAEDSDMLYRVLRDGWTVVCSDDITVVHHDWRTPRAETRLHVGYGLGAGAQTAKHLAGGDLAALRITLGEAARHLVTLARAVRHRRARVARLQIAWVLGLVSGLARRAGRGA